MKHSIVDPYLGTADAAAHCNYSESHFRQLVRLGKVPQPTRINGKLLWRRSALENFMAALSSQPRAESGGWGIVRYAPGTGRTPEEDKCHFDGWYSRKEDAQDVFADWCARHPGWIVALVSQQEARF
ncbi:helix-turn-helix domain-containing protein [Bradyrhizobium sp. Arg816]|uniref:helix-turn-helix domain-containing protein n=1 Tax=Bradyrhizobium sp. Arg816 TaxID=2998491 RepID=UPI00249D9258|nr:helix-turn-helix domain-containing protein [Bradyrhizobium sp. Arg816]MDI3563545.1 helix-turn-helix domain-containing protein [Bradyrhizobium sp. Arg816]